MTNSPQSNSKVISQLSELLSELTDGEFSPEIVDEIRDLVASNEAALRWYCDWMSLHADLYLDLAVGEVGAELQPPAEIERLQTLPLTSERSSRRLLWPMAAFATLTGALAASLAFLVFRPEPPPRSQPTAEDILASSEAARLEFQRNDTQALAVLSRAADARWSADTPVTQGAALPAGRFVLDSGVVQLEFLNGANLVVEGPADIELVSTKLVFCRRGKLRARVPAPAHGFTIETPTHRAIDLGTEFAVDVSADQMTEVHVLDGEVQLKDKLSHEPGDAADRKLVLGDGFRSQPDGGGSPIKADGARFIDAEQLLKLSRQDSRAQYSRWRQYSAGLATDPDVLAYFNFQEHLPWQRVLRQDGPLAGDSRNGAIVGCRWTAGRWPNKQALEFKGFEDRVKIYVPGEFDSLSLACWVRIEGFDRFLSSLMLTEGHNVGEIHWQFTDTGKLMLGVKADSDWSQDYYSGVVLRPFQVGRWTHLACVYDREVGIVAHYVDGRRVSTEAIRKNVTLRIGAADIGNWVPEIYRNYRIRNLNGRIDEFVLFDGAVSDGQIEEMYQAGVPGS